MYTRLGKIKTNFGYEGKMGTARALEVHYFYKIKESCIQVQKKTPGKASWKSQQLSGGGGRSMEVSHVVGSMRNPEVLGEMCLEQGWKEERERLLFSG